MTSFNNIGIVQLSGDHCFDFLNNQCINRIEPYSGCQYSVICNAKGRILFSFFIINNANSSYVAIHQPLTKVLTQYLNMRRFRMNVDIVVRPEKTLHLTDESIISPNQYPMSIKDLNEPSDSIIPTLFKWGLPWITEAYQEQHIPQHLNLDQKGVIDLKKGCYPGQEIIARLHYLGKIKKRMQLFTVLENDHNEPSSDPSSEIEWCSDAYQIKGKWLRQGVCKQN